MDCHEIWHNVSLRVNNFDDPMTPNDDETQSQHLVMYSFFNSADTII